MNRETWVGIAWAVGLVVAMSGVFAYEAATFELDPYDVTWAESSEPVGSESDSLQEAASETFTFAVDGTNLTRIMVELSWTDDVGDNDAFTLDVAVAGDEAWQDDDSGSSSPLAAAVQVHEGALPDSADGVDAAHAREGLAVPVPWQGMGNVSVTVRLDSAPGTSGTVPDVQDTSDGANSFEVVVTAFRVAATLTPA